MTLSEMNYHIWKRIGTHGWESLPCIGHAPEREILIPELIKFFEYKIGAEIGVHTGYFSRKICEGNKDIKLYCVDPYELYETVINMAAQERVYALAKANLAEFNVEFIRKRSLDALSDIPDGSLDFVYIDGLHDFDNVVMDIIGWNSKVRVGGMVSGHDFGYFATGVIHAVEAYAKSHNINPWFATNEPLASWFWIKR